jgi:hypothetical protein
MDYNKIEELPEDTIDIITLDIIDIKEIKKYF